jgi:hypothetical protein
MTKRETAIQIAKIAGYHNDGKSFIRAIVENRVNRQTMNQAWALGEKMRQSGVPCSCYECKTTHAPQ